MRTLQRFFTAIYTRYWTLQQCFLKAHDFSSGFSSLAANTRWAKPLPLFESKSVDPKGDDSIFVMLALVSGASIIYIM